ncbi:MAG: carbohydrate kinase family protein [Pseudomonadota bacterium]
MPSSARLLCIGDLGMDLVIRVPQLPGRDQKVSGREVARGPGGMAANVAAAASRLGSPCRLLATTGQDAMGQEALASLAALGIDLAHVSQAPGWATFYCVVLLDPSGEKALVRAVGETFLPSAEDLTPAAFEGVRHVHLIHPEASVLARAKTLADAVGATVSLDLEATDIPDDRAGLGALLNQVDVLFLGAESRMALEARLGALPRRPDRLTVTTRGALGAQLEDAGGITQVPGHCVDLRDTLGAGDAFAAAFLHAWLDGADLERTLRFANAAAALSTRGHGAQAGLPTESEVDAFMSGTETCLA